ncbi:MAG: hypothetical protein ACM3PP_10570 [Candidatus Saccharibacteria bacterium]
MEVREDRTRDARERDLREEQCEDSCESCEEELDEINNDKCKQ